MSAAGLERDSGVGAASVLELADGRRCEARVEPRALAVSCATGSATDLAAHLEGAFVGAPVVARAGAALLVGGATATEWELASLDLTSGATRWRTGAAGAELAIQLIVGEDAIDVSARSERGDHVDRVSMDGVVIGRRSVDASASRAPLERAQSAIVARTAWRAELPGLDPARPWHVAEGRLRAGGSRLLLTTFDGSIVWTIPQVAGCASIALADDAAGPFVAVHCANTSGVTVASIDAVARAARWQAAPYGIGPIGHSEYQSEVAIALDAAYVRVWGTESGGSYVSTLDRVSGREVATIVRRP